MAKSMASSTFQAPMISSIPALHAFDSQTSAWESYRDRINFYFKANRIDTDDDKKALFLWSVGDTTYNLLESLISPRSLTDDDTKFADLIKLLDIHYEDTKNIMTSTYDFYSCYQKTEQDPDLATTEKIIQLAERLQEDVRHFGSPVHHTDFTVAKLHNHQSKPYKQQHNSYKKESCQSCGTCGSNNHLRSQCKYREFICNFCKRSGHLEKKSKQSTEYSPTILLKVNGNDFKFELDTGTFNTIISECHVHIQYKDKHYDLPLIVINGSNSPLLGIQWIKMMLLNLNDIVHGQNPAQSYVHKIHNAAALNTTLQKYKQLLNKELDHCTKVQAYIQLKLDAIPN
ncbi:unnamed protein product, partial [Rotaria socialis]